MSKVDDLLVKAKHAIAAGEKCYREAAEFIFETQKAGATQKQIAEHFGKSQAWISQLLVARGRLQRWRLRAIAQVAH